VTSLPALINPGRCINFETGSSLERLVNLVRLRKVMVSMDDEEGVDSKR
jgi:hypothetical protein